MALDTFINGERKQTAKKRGETLRFELELAPPTEETTNELSYAQLVDDALKKDQDPQKVLGSFNEDSDAKLTAIARKFEEKYGPKKRKRIIHQSDLIDRGYGYDKNDSFVDDSEAYEDFVPVHVDTQFGGFYVNTGDLEFKQAEDVDEEELEFAFKKRKLPKLKKQPSHTTPQAILASQKLKKARQHVASQKAPKSTKSLQRALFPTTSTSSSTASTMTGASVLVKQASKAKSETTKKPKKVSIKSLPEITAPSLSGVLKSSSPSVSIGIGGISVPIFELCKKLNGADTTVSTVSASGSGAGGDSVQSSAELSVAPEAVKPPPVLPDNLPPTIMTKIHQLEEAVARDQGADGKVSNKMRASYDEQLVDIELACKAVTIKTRAAILEYLAFKLGVSRGTLVKRIKQMLRKKEEDALGELLHKLKEAVNASMPEQIAHYEEEVKTRVESLSSQITGPEKMEVDEDSKMEDVFEDSQVPSSSQQETTGKTVRAPRKKYKWTDETKKLVCEVVRVKVESEESINRIARGNGEEIINQFLEEKVKPLWPKGWMQKGILYKVSDSVHKHFTNPEKQPRKATVKKEKDKPLAIKKEEPIDIKPVTRPSMSVPLSLLVPVASPITKVQNPLTAKAGPITIPKVVQTTIATKTIQSAPSIKGAGGGALYQPGSVSKTVQFGATTVAGGKTAGVSTAGSLHTITPQSTMQAARQFKQPNLKGTTVGTMLAGAGRASEKTSTQLMKPETKPGGDSAAMPLSSTLLSQQVLSAVLVPHLQLSTSSNTASHTTSTNASIQAALAKLSQGAFASVKQSTGESNTPGATVKTKPVVQLTKTKVSAALQVPPPSSLPSSAMKASTSRHSQVIMVSNTQTSPRPAPSSSQTATTQVHSPLLQYPPVKPSVGVQSSLSTKPQVVGSSQSVIMAGRPSGALSTVTAPLPSPAPTSSHSSQSTSKQVRSPMEQILNEHSYDSHHQFIFVPTGVNPVIHTTTSADKKSSQSLLTLAARTPFPSCATSYGTSAPQSYSVITPSTGSQQTATYTTGLKINTLANLKMPESP